MLTLTIIFFSSNYVYSATPSSRACRRVNETVLSKIVDVTLTDAS